MNNTDKSSPECMCDAAIDRHIAGQSKSMCHNQNGGPCSLGDVFGELGRCVCDCSVQSTADSAKYIGMQTVRFSNRDVLGYWYSHPINTECREDESVGQFRSDGTQCTWKRRKEARVIYGQQVQNNGFRASSTELNLTLHEAEWNTAVFRRTF